jgi:hypothetical protein
MNWLAIHIFGRSAGFLKICFASASWTRHAPRLARVLSWVQFASASIVMPREQFDRACASDEAWRAFALVATTKSRAPGSTWLDL